MPGLPTQHLAKGSRFLGTASTLLAAGDGEGAIPALYFACLHAAEALLTAHGIVAETHRGVRQLLSLHFVKDGPLPLHVGRDFARLMAERDTADYDVVVPLEAEAGWAASRLALGVLEPILDLLSTRLGDADPGLLAARAAAARLADGLPDAA